MKLRLIACLALTSSYASAAVFLNELRIDQTGADNDEYVELFSSAPGSDSLDSLTLLVIGDGAGASGIIESVTSFAGIASPFASKPYFLVAETTFSVGTADFVTELNFENSDNITFVLVDGFSGMNGDDLDTDDDGTLDSMPWTSVVDALGLNEDVDGIPAEGGEYAYGSSLGASLGPDGTFVPGHAFRLGDAPGNWAIGDFAVGVTDTPGAANVIPEPSSFLLVLLGFLGLTRRRR